MIDMVKMMRSEWDGAWAAGEEKQAVGYFMRCRGFFFMEWGGDDFMVRR